MLAALALAGHAAVGAEQAADLTARVDAVFERWNSRTTPGCAVGVSKDGAVVLERGYGLADLERDVPIAPDTIFEAGSVSKQFTAAAVLLLARDGTLSLEDQARKYLPELPDYGAPLTVRQMLQHTSGLRDWGTMAEMAGWPRTTRVHTHAHVLEIVSRQRALNFPPGTDWSYSNTGYNLAAILVSRVAGEPFAEFTRRRIFVPLGMTSTSWRDDHTRVVKRRAIAYRERDGAFHINMPFENVHGNGGVLTTVGDLLKWNENFVRPKVGGREFIAEQQRRGRLVDGREHEYALGLYVRRYKGVAEIAHSGATAGYRAHLTRFPDQHVSVAVLCNVSSGAASQHAYEVAGLYLGDALRPDQDPAPVALSAGDLGARAGLYRSRKTGEPLRLVAAEDALKMEDGQALVALSPSRFRMGTGSTVLEFDGADGNRIRLVRSNGITDSYERVEPFRPSASELAAYAGRYTSSEAETELTIAVEGRKLVLKRRPDTALPLEPVYRDGFQAGFGLVRFHRTPEGGIDELSLVMGRAWDVRFRRVAGS